MTFGRERSSRIAPSIRRRLDAGGVGVGVLLVLALSLACVRRRTEIVARVDTDMTQGPTATLTGIHVLVTARDEPQPRLDQRYALGVGREPIVLPAELGITSRPEAARVTVEVRAMNGDTVMFSRRAVATFVPERTLVLEIFLPDRCRLPANQNCPAGFTCGRMGCEPIERMMLPELGNDAGDVTADNGTDSADTSQDSLDVVSDANDAIDSPADVACPVAECAGRCVDTRTDPRNCGRCGQDCTMLPNVNPGGVACAGGACLVQPGGCAMPFAHCTSNPDDGCETNTQTSATNCGACGTTCIAPPNAMPQCTGAMCTFVCAGGFHRCGTRCVSNTDPATCGTACAPCPAVANGAATCDGMTCGVRCNVDFADCDATLVNGCESDLSTPATCGACMTRCVVPAALCQGSVGMFRCASSCIAPTPTACAGSCVDTTTDADHCGTCGRVCPSVSNGTATCSASTCGFACNTGFHRCGTSCARNTDPAACGASCVPCPAPPANGTSTCDGTVCDFTCNAGYGRFGSTCVMIPPPRQISPGSSATVSSLTPELRWVLGPGTDGAHIEVCRDSACAVIVQTVDTAAAATTVTLPVALSSNPSELYFWRAFGRSGTMNGTIASPTWSFYVRYRSAPVSSTWAGYPDFNLDGFHDVVVGAPAAATVSVHPGAPSAPSSVASPRLSGATGSSFGASVASAGDVNGDGFTDLVVGAPGANAAFVFHGSSMGIVVAPARMLTMGAGSFGQAVAGVGDINRDGYADIAIAAPMTGNVLVYLGSATGIGAAPATTLMGIPGSFGAALASAGDVNADGFADLVVGSPTSAVAVVFIGSATGLQTAPAAMLTGTAGSGFGTSVAGAFDTTFDGYTDIAVGAPNAQTVFVYTGSAMGVGTTPAFTLTQPLTGFGTAIAVGDVDYNGYDDIFVTSAGGSVWDYASSSTGPGARRGWVLDVPPPAGAMQFGASAAGGGYVNGDRYADIVIGAPGSVNAFVYPGANAAITSATTPWVLSGAAGSLFGRAVAMNPSLPPGC